MAQSHLIDLLDRWKPTRIVVAGDFMLDRYAYGNAERLSPDAPVPVLAVERTVSSPGGSANVCLDLAALRCEVRTLGIIGDDEPGQALAQALEDAGVQTSGLVATADRPTTVKHNFVGLAQHRHPQKMFRLDTEDKSPIADDLAQRLLDQAESILDGADVLCLEDYNKGVLTEAVCQGLISLARERNLPVFVDPAAIDDYTKYRRATCITPNRTETAVATGTRFADTTDPAVVDQMAQDLRRNLELEAVLLTLDKDGILLATQDGAERFPTVARSVYDVTGAGDMVLAMLAAARANDIGWVDAVALANVAAGLEVEKSGVVPIPLDEILLSLLQQDHDQLGKVRTLDQLLPELDAHRKQGAKVVFTNGCFDILHAGHVAYLRKAAALGDLLVVGLNSDDSIRSIKGPDRPVNQQDDRLLVLSELQSIDYLVVFDDDTPLKLIEAIKPTVLAKGADYTRETVVGHEIVEAHGGHVALIDLVEGRSTTNIIQKLGATQR